MEDKFEDALDGSAPAGPVDAGQLCADAQTIGVFLEEVAFFLEDMDQTLWWLCRAAHQPTVPPVILGSEELVRADEAVEGAIDRLRARAEAHAESHANQVRAKIMLIPQVTSEERAVLDAVKGLKFHCKGRVEVFPCMKEANNSAVWGAFFKGVSAANPHWMVRSDGPGQNMVPAQCVVIVPVHVNKSKKEIKLFNVWCPEKKKRHWSFPGGDVVRGTDRSLFDTARRAFEDEVGVFFGLSWSECFVSELPREWDEAVDPAAVCLCVQLDTTGPKYPCRPYFFVQVTEDFYETTRAYEEASGAIRMPQPEGAFVRWDDAAPKESARRVHLEGARYLQHDEACWVKLEYETGKMCTEDGRQVRKENAELMKLQDEKIYSYLANLCGLEKLEKRSALPHDLPDGGPFAVRVSGIDKNATDDDVRAFFEASSVACTKVEQFQVPKHTARVDFPDRQALEMALQLNSRSLLRRKVTVELWSDDGGVDATTAAPSAARPLKPYDGPLPDSPPFKVYIRGLDKKCTRDDLGYFFWDRECQVKDVDFPLKQERHAGILEFENLASLKTAMGLNQAVFQGRELEIDFPQNITQRPAERGGGGGGGFGGGKGGKGGGKSKGGGGGFGGGKGGKGGGKSKGGGGFGRDRDGFDREGRPQRDRDSGRDRDTARDRGPRRDPPSRADFGSERPRLALQPRSKPLPGEPGYRDPGDAQERPNIFGGARPRDDRFKDTRADGDSNWRK